jgi:DNA helicase-2/ATP-dependent DNA helicase PcrA
VLKSSDENTNELDFDDMLRFALRSEVAFPRFTTILLDEAQDTNPIQVALLEKMAATRTIIVGDKFQSIYGFRGAHTSAMDCLRQAFNATVLPLSVSWRCSVAVCREANAVLVNRKFKL